MKIIYGNNDGTLAVIIPSKEWMGSLEELAKKVVSNMDYEIVDDVEIPIDRTFRNAWKRSGRGIVLDMPKAREIWRGRIREARVEKLGLLDTEYMRADEAGDTEKKKEIAQAKQVLRDLPQDPRIENAQSAEELKAIWLE